MAFPHTSRLIWQNLPHTATLQVVRSVRDSLGGDKKQYLTVQELSGFMQEISREERLKFQGRLSNATHRWYFDDTVSVRPENRLVYRSTEYKVLAVSAATVNMYPQLNAALCQVMDGDVDVALP